ncbi:NAD(P)-dependent oxidoreductase [Paenibacillus sp. SN-8-1]|uniref:NAD(P)-dependent oxidoreductase n=1 Tax=Paenibacillus sp. SN-8-1 TaxID=3435409 RepID=UPI003D9A5DCF
MNTRHKIAIIGGTGTVGSGIVKHALAEGYTVRMLVRSRAKLTVSSEHLEIVEGDARDSQAVAEVLKGCDVVINTFGQPTREKSPIYTQLTGQILDLMKIYGIRRYIGVTGGSLNAPGDRKSFVNRLGAAVFRVLYSSLVADKEKELALLQSSDADWTLIRLPFVVEGSASGRVKVNEKDMPGTKMRTDDIADFVLGQIEDRQYIQKTPFISN